MPWLLLKCCKSISFQAAALAFSRTVPTFGGLLRHRLTTFSWQVGLAAARFSCQQVLLGGESWKLDYSDLLSICPYPADWIIQKIRARGCNYEKGWVSVNVVSRCVAAIVDRSNKLSGNTYYGSTDCLLSDDVLKGSCVKSIVQRDRITGTGGELRKVVFFPVLVNKRHFILLVLFTDDRRLVLCDSLMSDAARSHYDDLGSRFVCLLKEEFNLTVHSGGTKRLLNQSDDFNCGACVCYATECICFKRQPRLDPIQYRLLMLYWLASHASYCHPAIRDNAVRCFDYGWLVASRDSDPEGGARGHNSPGTESLSEALESPNNVASNYFFYTVNLLPNELRFEQFGAPNLLFTPGAIWLRYAPDRSPRNFGWLEPEPKVLVRVLQP